MKKLLGILVLGLLWCNVGFALTQQEAIDQYLSGRKLDNIEGIWASKRGNISAIYKSGSTYKRAVIRNEFLKSGEISASLIKGNDNYYYGTATTLLARDDVVFKSVTDEVQIDISGNYYIITGINKYGKLRAREQRIWPENFNSYNTKFEKKKEEEEKKKSC